VFDDWLEEEEEEARALAFRRSNSTRKPKP
jgi:hypothetical protein